MKKILFVCHGNICRSTMAQFMFYDLVKRNGLLDQYYIDSAATSMEEIGNPIYHYAKEKLVKEGISIIEHYARRVTIDDYNNFDLILIMDSNNYRNLVRIVGNDNLNKIKYLLDYTDLINKEIDDPWYTNDFDTAYDLINKGINGLFNYLEGR